MSPASSTYLVACEDYRKAHDRVISLAHLLQRVGSDLLANPEGVAIENTTAGVPQTVLPMAKRHDGRNWPEAAEINRLITHRVEARLKCEHSFQALSTAEQRSVKNPSEVIVT